MLKNCENDVWFYKHKHQVHNSDLFYIKRGKATEERIGGFMDENSVFNIALIYKDHKFYNEDIQHHHICDFPLDEFRDFELKTKKLSSKAKNKLKIKKMNQKISNLEGEIEKQNKTIKLLQDKLNNYESNEELKQKVIILEANIEKLIKENNKIKYGKKNRVKK